MGACLSAPSSAPQSAKAKQPIALRDDITLDEVWQHSTKKDFWTVINGKVYDCTEFLSLHPGGVSIMMPFAGKDTTDAFMKYHPSVNYHGILRSGYLGTLAAAVPATAFVDTEGDGNPPPAAQ